MVLRIFSVFALNLVPFEALLTPLLLVQEGVPNNKAIAE